MILQLQTNTTNTVIFGTCRHDCFPRSIRPIAPKSVRVRQSVSGKHRPSPTGKKSRASLSLGVVSSHCDNRT